MSRQHYTREQRLKRACLRAATHIRGHWEETGYSDTRLIDAIILPDSLTVVGITDSEERPLRREHVVPRIFIIEECKRRLRNGAPNDIVAKLIEENTKIVLISVFEQRRLDAKIHVNLSQDMPPKWRFGDDIFARLRLAGIEWHPYSWIGYKDAPLEEGLQDTADLS